MDNSKTIELEQIPAAQEGVESQLLSDPEKGQPPDVVESGSKFKLRMKQAKSWTLNFILPASDEGSDLFSAIKHFV